jgi:site-specific recombinase XerD
MTADVIPAFKLYLRSKNYSISTIRNYIADLGKYFSVFPTLNADSLIVFLTKESASPNYPRTLASLRLFCQFALDQQHFTVNPLKTALKHISSTPQPNLDQIVTEFSKYLTSHQASDSTIKNYINDVNQYISWVQNQPTQNLPPTPSFEERRGNFSSDHKNPSFFKEGFRVIFSKLKSTHES